MPGSALPALPEHLEQQFRGLEDLFSTLRPPARAAAIHSVRHLRKAWAIRAVDPDMAIFRAITAEEEAATAIIRSLQRLGYHGADRLSPRRHPHKAGLWPMLLAVNNAASKLPPPWPIQLAVVGEGAAAHYVLRMLPLDENGERVLLPNGQELVMVQDPPLEITLHENLNDGRGDVLHDFGTELAELAARDGHASIIEKVRERANLRNRILYATMTGYREADGDVGPVLEAYSKSTKALLLALLLVDPPNVVQRFAQQVVDAYVGIVAKRGGCGAKAMEHP